MLQLLAKLIKALNSDSNPTQLSLGFVLGIIMGLTPVWSMHNLVVVLLVCVIRVNISSFVLAFGAFSGIAYMLDSLFIICGETLLQKVSLISFWTSLYQSDFWRLTHFNNTLTLGSLVIAMALAVPLFFTSRILIIKYRESFMVFVEQSRLMKWLKATKFYHIYQNLSDARGLIQ